MTPTRNTALALLALAAGLGGCNATVPQGTDAAGVPEINYELTDLKDRRFEFCAEDTLDQALDQAIGNWGLKGCAAGFAYDGEILYLTAQGSMNAVDSYGIDTLQPIGSVSKPMTAVAALRLVELGYLGLGDTVEGTLGAAVSEHPDWVKEATLHELLTHTSGIDDRFVKVLTTPVGPDVALADASWTNVDWESWGYADDPTLGRSPLLAQEPILFHENQGTTPEYSNVGYLLIGAMIEQIVSDPGFAGFDEYPLVNSMERTYEAWVWWVFAGEGQLASWHMYSPVLRNPWRLESDAFPNLATGYHGSEVNEVWTASDAPIPWEDFQDEYGWAGPSGGWMTTIGDLTRLGIVIGEEKAFTNAAWWTLAKYEQNEVRGDGYGYGLTRYDAAVDESGVFPLAVKGSSPMWGHGGTMDGFVAGSFAADDGRVIAWQCNTTPRDDDDEHVSLHQDVSETLLFAFDEEKLALDCPASGGVPKVGVDYDAIDILSNDYVASELDTLAASIARYGLEAALALEERLLGESPEGILLLAYLQRGDWDAAAECALVLLDDDQGQWSCR